jgi:DNA-binding XRE family transcriptional regulator
MNDLKTYRETHNLSCAALGKMIGVTRATVLRWEDGTRRIGVTLIPKVAQVTGIPREKLRPDIFGDAQ